MTLDELPELMTAKQLAEYLQTTEAALSQDRYLGRGVPFIKAGAKRVRYLRADVESYLQSQRMTRTG